MSLRLASVALVCIAFAACAAESSQGPASTSSGTTATTGTGGTGGGGGEGTGGSPSTGGIGGATGGGGTGTTTASGGTGGTGTGTFDCSVDGVPGTCLETTDCAAVPDHASTPGFCPGPSTIQCCTPYGTALCDPAVLQYPNDGNVTEAPGEGGCPPGMLAVETFCVDKYEATLVKVSDGSSWSPFLNPGTTPMIAISVAGAVPQGYIDGVQAGEACTNAGKRLCTDAEWLRACQGPAKTTYPYGDTKELGVCNDHRDVHPAFEFFVTSASWIYSHIDNACLNQLPESVDLTGSLPGCVTAEGAFDMMGNLHEWTADPNGTFRGGYYVDTVINGPGCLYATTAHNTLHWDYSTGFRCCAD